MYYKLLNSFIIIIIILNVSALLNEENISYHNVSILLNFIFLKLKQIKKRYKMQQVPIIPLNAKVSAIECPGFNYLTEEQKLYAYHFVRASWSGAKICYFQRSYEAPGLFYLFQKIFIHQDPQQVRQLLEENEFTKHQVDSLFVYIAAFFQNCGNYKSFGDTKFIPDIDEQLFEKFVKLTKAYSEEKETFDQIWNLVHYHLYTYEQPYGLIDLPERNGRNSYYSNDLGKELIEQLDQFLHTKHISELNTRLIKKDDQLVLLVASAVRNDVVELGEVAGHKVVLQYGDFKPFLSVTAHHLEQAIPFAANENQANMLKDYVEHFKSGDMEKHKDSQRHWIKDKGPVIETNIGFIETYLDPMKVRAEFEGFVAVVNKIESELLNNLVNRAEKIIEYLPWPKEFEIEKFSKPDFTSLEILTFGCSGTPIGINIPNYDDIRQNEGFKNVNLGNVYGKPNAENIRFIQGEDLNLFVKYYTESLFVVVALHELIGHGSGKIFLEDKDGKLNYENVTNPFTNQPVTTHYNSQEHWHAKFGPLSGAYEECRADSVALYLSTYDDVVEILLPKQSKEERIEIVKAAWLDIINGGIKGLEYYSVEQKKWGQPHILASYVILQALIQADPNIIKFEFSELEGKEYFTFSFDYSKIWTVGKQAIGDLLRGLQVYKAIADGVGGIEFFNKYTQVDDQFLKLRTIVINHKQPRKVELQPDVQLVDGKPELVVFPETYEGVIQSHIVHYQRQVEDVKELFLTTQQLFKN
ncbi:hypothetical protein pb186bvf_003138 [Paramecium bursaria]